ncbi:MAG: hypothetical protein ACR2IK_03860 [Chloroflexota bacterium]
MTEIAVEKNSTIIFPLANGMIEPFLNAVKRFGSDETVREPAPGERDGNGAVPVAARA